MILEAVILILAIIAIILILIFINVRRKKKIEQLQEAEKKQKTIGKYIGLNESLKNPKESLISLNKIAREFFKEYLNQKHIETYSEIEDELIKRKEKSMMGFCENMNYLLYSGKTIAKEDALLMINQFNDILRDKKKDFKQNN